jgi:hypothetical protein
MQFLKQRRYVAVVVDGKSAALRARSIGGIPAPMVQVTLIPRTSVPSMVASGKESSDSLACLMIGLSVRRVFPAYLDAPI